MPKYTPFEEMSKSKTPKKVAKWTIALFVIVIIAASSLYTVRSSERGVLSTFGKIDDEAITPGLHIKIPFIQTVTTMSVRTQKITLMESVYTKDVQTADVELEVNYDLNPAGVAMLYKQIGRNYEEKVINPVIRGTLKDAFGDFNATAIVENRDIVKSEIEKNAREQLNNEFFSNIRVQIANIDYDDTFEKAISEKQTAEQDALKAKNKTIQIEEEAKQTRIKAEADAEAIRIKAQALEKNPKITEYEAIQKWNGELPTYMLGNSVPFINLGTK